MNSMTEDSLRDAAKILNTVRSVYEKLEEFQEIHPFLATELESAQECVEEAVEMADDETNELSQALSLEKQKGRTLGLYVRMLEEFCRDSHTAIPSFILHGFRKLCPSETAWPISETQEENGWEEENSLPSCTEDGELPFLKEAEEQWKIG